jgi:hypothetical protein
MLHICSVNTYCPYRARFVPGGVNICIMPGSWSGDWFTGRSSHKYDFPALPMGSTKSQHHYMQG